MTIEWNSGGRSIKELKNPRGVYEPIAILDGRTFGMMSHAMYIYVRAVRQRLNPGKERERGRTLEVVQGVNT